MFVKNNPSSKKTFDQRKKRSKARERDRKKKEAEISRSISCNKFWGETKYNLVDDKTGKVYRYNDDGWLASHIIAMMALKKSKNPMALRPVKIK